MSNSGSENVSEPYILIYIKPSKAGEKGLKQIVPASAIKRFDFDAYKNNKNIYKDKQLKVRLNPNGQKEKCYILYVGESHYEVSNAVMNGKRIRIPNTKFIESVDEDSSTTEKNSQTAEEEEDSVQEEESNEEGENDEQRSRLLKDSKKQRKQINENKKKASTENNNKIIDNYLQNSLDGLEENENNHTLAESSSVHNDNNVNPEIRKNDSIYVKQLEYQLTHTRRELMNMKKVPDENHHRDNRNNHACNTGFCENVDLFKVHDKIYGFNKERQEEELKYDDEGNVHLGCDVYCTPIAYNASFKSKNPSKCLALLSEGVYGLNELSKRCVRKQKNTKGKKVLSPVKKMVIESKVYAFMRIKDKTISQVDDFLNNLNVEHRKVINNAAVRLLYMEKQKEIEQELDAVLRDEFSANSD